MKDLLHGKPSSLALPYRRAAQQWRCYSTGIDQPATGYADDSDIPRGHPRTETTLPEQGCDQREKGTDLFNFIRGVASDHWLRHKRRAEHPFPLP